MNKHTQSSRKRSADHLESQHVVKKTKYVYTSSSRHHTTGKQQSGSYSRYKHQNILPDVDELNLEPGISSHVKPHIVKGGYDNWQHYLTTQFNLLREDFVAPLRQGIYNYRNFGQACDIKVYERATFTEMVLNENGILLSVEFKATNNLNQKRLINGNLLCFSHDNFETIIFATVVNQRDWPQNNRVIRVKIESDNNELSIPGFNINDCIIQEYTIIEAPGHYETSYHFLSSLKHANPHKMPFTNYLIDFNYHKIRRPHYLTGNSVFRMAEVLEFKKDNSYSSFDIIGKWPSYEPKLNKSQHEALQHALTHEVALIQGPPGTGKTFIGKKIVEALLVNKKKWDRQGISPILVVCYTNQALDQFLEKLIESDIIKDLECSGRNGVNCKIVRIGGGCESEKVKEYCFNSKERQKIVKKKPIGSVSYFKSKRELQKASKKIKQQMELLITDDPPSIKDLSKFIPPVHYDQLRKWHPFIDMCIDVWLQGCRLHYNQQNNDVTYYAMQLTLNNSLTKAGCNKAHGNQEYKNDFAVIKLRKRYPERQIAYTTTEVESIDDINVLSLNERKRLYHHWVRLYHNNLYNETCCLIDEFNEIHAKFINAGNTRDARSLQNAMVIGMTATGAAKHRYLLEELKPKIVIVEEAAELMESHIIPCLSATTEHLILIGDHKQLQPKPQDYHLACKYNLNVSLFERLIRNNIPHITLTVQYRMRPEIAGLICPHIYPKLENDKKVTKYKNIRGIKTNMYFFNHKYKENKHRNSHSYHNAREANLVAGLCNYLLNQEYEPSKVTVLAAYASQVNELMELIPAATIDVQDSHMEEISKCENEQYVKIKTIDNYQGEENDIIILSLVRSNDMDKLGFLQFENRVCVALSRARKGLYCFGNFDLLCKSKKSHIWQKILDDLKNKNQLGSTLQLCCGNHPESITTITQPEDFQKVPEGGCSLQCNAPLGCGHTCMLKCHIKDMRHDQYVCKEMCLKKCRRCGEPCKLKCFIDCQKCEVLIEKTIPKCNHTQHIPCYMKAEEFECKERCNKTCLRGHPCALTCSEVCKCLEMKTKILKCGHKVILYCFQNYAVPDCTAPCNKTCTTNARNPHRCTKRCSDTCGDCEATVEVTLPWCGHKQKIPCHKQSNLNLYVDTSTITCTEMIKKTFPTCGHTAVMPCGTNVLDYSCFEPVAVKLPCGHNKHIECYKTQCGAVLPSEKCNVKVTKYFQICKHVTELPCCDSHLMECPVKCNTVLLCGHKCTGTCHECHQGRLHKPCMFHVSKLLCGHETTMKCSSAMIEPYPSCSYRCERFCAHKKCFHKCQDLCKPCNSPCDWQCPHYKCTRKCHEKCNRQRCYEPCQRLNKCGHPCIGVCGEPCPDVCKLCDEEQFLQLYVSLNQFKTKDDTTYIQLDCDHLFKRTELDPWVDACSKELQLISCPKCNQTIHLNQRRYANAIRRTYDDITEIRHMMNEDVETNVKIKALVRYYRSITNVIKLLDLTNLKTLFLGLTCEELQQLQIPADTAVSSNTKFNEEVQKFIENKNNWSSAINVIINFFDSILSLLKFSSQGNSDVEKSLQALLEFTVTNHTSLSLQLIQDVTREQKRLALWIMVNQLKSEILDHPDSQTVKQVENVLIPIEPGRFKPLLPQLTKRLYSILSQVADKYGTTLLDKKYIATPKLPLLHTGRWTQCIEDHYYCIPQQLPEIPCDFLTSQCPHCTEYDDDDDDDDDEDMDV